MNKISFTLTVLGLFLFVIIGNSAFGAITLPAVFSKNRVLQQNADVAIWGWANAVETIKIVADWNSAETI